MSNLLKTGLAWLTQQLSEQAAEDAIYRRGSLEIPVRATFGKKLLRIQDADGGIRVELTDMDFLIPADDIDFGYGPVIPERGDQIDITLPYDTQTFEAMPFGSEPAWRWADPVGQTMVRVHTKHLDTQQFYP